MVSNFNRISKLLAMLINAKAINEIAKAKKNSLISRPLIENIQWQRNRSEVEGSGLHT
jgi:hypothetical protein